MSLHLRLRAATADAHEGLERALDWKARVATGDGYRSLLARLHGFHAAYEPMLGLALADEAFWAPRRRLAALEADLAHLGLSEPEIAALPRPMPVRLTKAAEAMGALYVLEGSTLGGQVIGRHIGTLHGLDAAGLAYYRAHGRETGRMWNAFRARLDALSGDPDAEDAAFVTGIATFEALRRWLCDPQESSDARQHRAGCA